MRLTTRRADRLEALRAWEAVREAPLVVAGCWTRPSAEAEASARAVFEHVRELPRRPMERVDLLLFGSGIPTETAARIVSVLRDYVREVRVVLVGPVGAGETLAALAADELLMHPLSALSGLGMAGGESRLDGIESLLLRTDPGTPIEALVRLFGGADPALLGQALKRADRLRHLFAEACDSRLLPPSEAERAELFQALTRAAGGGDGVLTRRAARGIRGGLPVVFPTPELEALMLELGTLWGEPLGEGSEIVGVIESAAAAHLLRSGSEERPATWQRVFDGPVH